MYCSQKLGEDFAKFCSLLRKYELYQEFFIRGNAPVDFRTNLQQFGLVEKSFISVHRIGKSNYEKLIHTA